MNMALLVAVIALAFAAQSSADECPQVPEVARDVLEALIDNVPEGAATSRGLAVVMCTTPNDCTWLVELLSRRVKQVLVMAEHLEDWQLLELCSRKAWCVAGNAREVPIAPQAAHLVVAIDSWDFAEESARAHARLLGEWLEQGGHLVLAQSPNAQQKIGAIPLAQWSKALATAGLFIVATGGALRNFAVHASAIGTTTNARHQLSTICDVLSPRCEMVGKGLALRTIPGSRDPAASLYEAAFFGDEPRLLAVRDDPDRVWWSCRRSDLDRGLLGLIPSVALDEPLAVLPKYFSTYSEHVAVLVPHEARRILDVGCGAGLLLRKLKLDRESNLTVEGVEPNPDAALAAQTFLDAVYQGFAEDVAPLLPDAAYDAIILSDVLEHALHPDLLLKRLAPKLKPGGRVCVSVPNMRYWTEFVRPLLDGSWDYAPHGVRDRTHLRWFTHNSFLKMARAGGFVPDGPALRLHFGDEHKLPHDLARALLDVLGHDATNRLFEESDVRQFLIPLKPCQPFTDGDSSNLPLCPAS